MILKVRVWYSEQGETAWAFWDGLPKIVTYYPKEVPKDRGSYDGIYMPNDSEVASCVVCDFEHRGVQKIFLVHEAYLLNDEGKTIEKL
jgi:hypothetical protein